MFITKELLEAKRACEEQRDRFAELFPQGVELTRELIVQYAQEFSWSWCAENLASAAGRAAYDQAERSAWDAYDRAVKPACVVYLQAEEQAYATDQQAIAPAQATLNLACAAAFADAIGL